MLNWKNFTRLLGKPECDFAQNALIAAFDDQADEAQLLRAAEHRAHCAGCQSVWSEWEKTRALLRAVPAPIVPASLREHILLTCRSLPDAELSSSRNDLLQNESVPARADLIAYLDAPDSEFSVARLAQFAPEVAPPPTLSRQILEHTTQAKTTSRRSLWPAAREFFLVGSTPATRMPRAARWGFVATAPALAAWLIFIAQTSFIEIPKTDNVPANVPASTATPSLEIATKPGAKSTKHSAAAFAQKPVIKSSAPKIATLPPVNSQALENLGSVFPEAAHASNDVVPLRVAKVTVRKSDTISTLGKIAPKNSVPTRKLRVVPLVDKSVSASPHLSRVSLDPTAPHLHLTVKHPYGQNAKDRISSPASAAAPASLLADARFADADFDESLSAIARQRDNRPEDLGRAIDEYSASLLTENAGENDIDGLS